MLPYRRRRILWSGLAFLVLGALSPQDAAAAPERPLRKAPDLSPAAVRPAPASAVGMPVEALVEQTPQSPVQEPDTLPLDTLRAQDPAPVDTLPEPDPLPQSREERDEEIRAELQATFDRVDALRSVEVEVEAGIVRLEGTVPVQGDRARADTLARRLDGVVLVEDAIQVDRSLQRRWAATWDQLRGWGLDAVGYLPLMLAALAIIVVSVFLARVSEGWLEGRMSGGSNPYLRSLIRRGIRLVIVSAGFLVALNLLGATWIFGAILGTAGIAGLAVGFAFQDIIQNYLAGILLSLRNPFAPRDHVVLAGQEGKVVRLTARETILMTLSGNHVRIPNAMVFASVILNYTRNPLRQFTFDISVGLDADLALAQDRGVEVLRNMNSVLTEPHPTSHVVNLEASSARIRFLAWVDQEATELDRARSEGIRLVKAGLEGAGIRIPSPEYSVVWTDGGAETVGVAPPFGPLRPGVEPTSQVPVPATPTPPERPAEPDRTVDVQIEREENDPSEEPNLLQPAPPSRTKGSGGE